MGARGRTVLAAAVLLFLAGCTQLPPEGGGTGTTETIVPPTTKVLDADAREGLLEVGDQGTLRFASETGVADAIEVGDVVVSEPTAAAPSGLLRKVTSVRSEGGEVIVETVAAELREAVHQGSLSVSLALDESDLAGSTALQSGIEVQAFEHVIDSDFGTNGAFRATGTLNIQPILELDIDITCNDRKFGICIEIPDLDLLFKIGLTETANLKIEGSDALAFDEQFVIASHDFAPITFTIAFVPIVLTPRLEVYLTASGTLSGELVFVADQDLAASGGFTYNSDRGFRNVSENTVSFDRGAADFAGQAVARAAVGGRFELYLYGAVGPYGALEAGPRIEANQSGLPGTSTTLWELEGCLTGLVGIDSIPVLGIEYEATLFGRCTTFARETDEAPTVFIQAPTAATQIFVGDDVTLRGSAFDPNGHTVACRWTSSLASDPFPVAGCTTQVSFATAGSRTLTLVGTDPVGTSEADTVTVTVSEQPLVLVTVTNPQDQQHLAAGEAIVLAGSASGGLEPYAYQWSIAYPTDLNGNGGVVVDIGPGASRVWIPEQTIDVDDCDPEFAKMILDATDADGFVGSRSVMIRFGTIC
ncbi:MAG: hypothetical protein U5J97_10850 [Trueperaceae bacterium]|nr:hypothetical protein [Trueperaceae bacterium]